VVLVPAHDEEKVLAQALTAIRAQLEPSDRLVVVADNCTDSTADVARKLGATVVERRDPLRPGKGYALDAGARFLESDPREAVIVIDADCVPQEGAIGSLARAMAAANGPVQGAYLMTAPAGS
jgi:glycosyltransferase involved in cell wall biosynthesis